MNPAETMRVLRRAKLERERPTIAERPWLVAVALFVGLVFSGLAWIANAELTRWYLGLP